MNTSLIALCSPDSTKSCFACCPPIRPAGYEHIQFKSSIQRMLQENTEQFDASDSRIAAITGFSCWGLGYLDKTHRLIGCLLHPNQNQERDLRFRIDYGEKCRREGCEEAKIFSELDIAAQKFLLCLTDNLDSFEYSSRSANPLFDLLGWGTRILGFVAECEAVGKPDRETFFQKLPFLRTTLPSRAYASLLKRIIDRGTFDLLMDDAFRISFEEFAEYLAGLVRRRSSSFPDGKFVHLLGLDPEFANFLRLACGVFKITPASVEKIKRIVDQETEKFLVDLKAD